MIRDAGIGSYFYNILKSMYSCSTLRVKAGHRLTEKFSSSVGIRQGDNLSPTLFNIFLKDVPTVFAADCDPVCLSEVKLSSLMYADDIVLLSGSATGLQCAITSLYNRLNNLGLQINVKKTKIMVFKTSKSKLAVPAFYAGNQLLESTKRYKYLGIIFCSSGSWQYARDDLYNKGSKAFFKLRQMMGQRPEPNVILHLFDHTIKPVLLYSSEVWGTFNTKRASNAVNKIDTIFQTFPQEKLNTRTCKFALGVHKKATNAGVFGELGRYPLYITGIINTVKYWHRLSHPDSANSPLLSAAYKQNISTLNMPDSWISSVRFIFEQLGLTSLFKYPGNCTTNHIVKTVKNRLMQNFRSLWSNKLCQDNADTSSQSQGNKLRTYRQFKTGFHPEPYLKLIRHPKHRMALTRFRISAHRLGIEVGRYRGLAPSDRLCTTCDLVDDEFHFLLHCTRLDMYRATLFEAVAELCPNFNLLDPHNKFIWLLSTEDKKTCQLLGEYTHKSFSLLGI
jgi:hypothetical protein